MATSTVQRAPAPTHTTASFTLQWGLVPVKIRLFTSTEDTNPVKRSLYTKTGSKVIQPKTDSATMKPVAAADIVSKVEIDGKLVELSDEEIAEVTSDLTIDRRAVEIQFVPADSIGSRYLVDKTYQARSGRISTAKRTVPDPQADKALALLLQSMEKRKVACLFRASLKGPARYAALTPDGKVHFLFYDGEVRAEADWPDVDISKTEAAQGLDLIDGIGVSTPDLIDERAERLHAHLRSKIAKGDATEAPAAATDGAPVEGVLDLTAALEASIAAAAKGKPAVKKTAAKKAAAKRTAA